MVRLLDCTVIILSKNIKSLIGFRKSHQITLCMQMRKFRVGEIKKFKFSAIKSLTYRIIYFFKEINYIS